MLLSSSSSLPRVLLDRARCRRRTLSGEPQSIIAANSNFHHNHYYYIKHLKIIVERGAADGLSAGGPQSSLVPNNNSHYDYYIIIVSSEVTQTWLFTGGPQSTPQLLLKIINCRWESIIVAVGSVLLCCCRRYFCNVFQILGGLVGFVVITWLTLPWPWKIDLEKNWFFENPNPKP